VSPEIEYARFVEAFGADPGMLPDGEVVGTSQRDWDAVFAMLHASEWRVATFTDSTIPDSTLPLSPADFPLGDVFAVWPTPGLRVHFFHFREGVFFDIDLREIVSQAAADGLADFMRALGSGLGRDVVILDEGLSGLPVLRYVVTRDSFSWC
jgi:hypothetical protein